MKLENQVCTAQQSLQLVALGIENKSLFYYHTKLDRPHIGTTVFSGKQICNDKQNTTPAFTVAELGVMLPAYEESHKASDEKGYWYCGHVEGEDDWTCDDYQAKVMAKRLIQLLESGRTTPDEVNQRLNH